MIQFPAKAKISLLQSYQNSSGVHRAFCSEGTEGSIPEGKGVEAWS